MISNATDSPASDFSALAASRRSIRAYTDQQIPQDILDAILKDATTAPSWSNTRAFRVALATGERADRPAQRIRASIRSNPDIQHRKPFALAKTALRRELPDGDFPSGSLTHASFAQLKLKSPSVYMAPMALNAAITRGATLQTAET